ncbi:hypothetical protein [Prevotella sp.]|uniref:hypothetical protein n=1 Tax=Prevotella sp. TaxID=59823 RepID=UPI0025FCF3E3|nr:hypothetical protein [Prevotella sp.]
MENSDLEIKGRRLRKEEALFLLTSAMMFEDTLEERYCKNGTFTLTQKDMAAALFVFGRKIMPLYASGSLDKTVAEPFIAKEEFFIAEMKAAGVDTDVLLQNCEPEDESYKEEEYGDDNQH